MYPVAAFAAWSVVIPLLRRVYARCRYTLAYYGTDGDPEEPGTKLLIAESRLRLGNTIEDGWIIFDYWVIARHYC